MSKVTLIIFTSVLNSALGVLAMDPAPEEQAVYELIDQCSPRELYNASIVSQSPQNEQDIYFGDNPSIYKIFRKEAPGCGASRMNDRELFMVEKEHGAQENPLPWNEYVREVSFNLEATCSTKFKERAAVKNDTEF